MKITIDNQIYYVNHGKEDEHFDTKEAASEQDVAIMLEALKIVQMERPKVMAYLKVYKVNFVQLRTKEGHLHGQKEAIPTLILWDPTSGRSREKTLQISENGFSDGACLFLPLSDADAIARWIVKHLDQHIHCQVGIAERDLRTWKHLAEEADPWPFSSYRPSEETVASTFGELQPGRYEVTFRDERRTALLEIQPHSGSVRVRFLRGHPVNSKTGALGKHAWTILPCAPDKGIEDFLHEELWFEGV